MKTWGLLSARHQSYAVYGILAPVLLISVTWAANNLESVECLRLATADTAVETLENLAIPQCGGQPFSTIAGSFTASDVPEYDNTLGITQTSARTWTAVFAYLVGATVAASIAGATSSLITSHPDTNKKGWVWGTTLSIAGLAVAASLISLGTKIFQPTFGNKANERIEIDYAQLLDPFGAVTTTISILGGAVMAAAVVAIGHNIHQQTTQRHITLDDLKRATSSTSVVLVALAASLSLGVLSTAARIRLMEHLPGLGDLPGLVSILFGVLFSVLIAALYVPTQTRLRHARDTLIDQEAGQGLDAETLKQRKQVSEELDRQLGRTGPAGTALAVLGPFVTAAASTVLT